MDLKPTVRVFCELSDDYSLSIRDGKVVLAHSNPRDPFQHWIKKEVDGGGFSLFNKGTAQAIKRSPNVSPVNKEVIELLLISIPFNSPPDPDALWIEKKEGEKGFSTVFGKQGGKQGYRLQPHSWLAYDGNTVLLSNQDPGPYQKWKFVPYSEDEAVLPKIFRIYNAEKPEYNLTIRNDTVVFARSDRADPYQHWRKEKAYCQHFKDEQGFPAFAIVNVATGKAIRHGIDQSYGYPVTLFPFNPTYLEKSLLWTESDDQGSGFKKIKLRNYVGYGLDVLYDKEWMSVGLQEGMRPGVWKDGPGKSHQWKMESMWDAGDASTTAPAKPSNQWNPSNADVSIGGSNNNSKPGQWNPSNADISFDSSNNNSKPGQWNPSNADMSFDSSNNNDKPGQWNPSNADISFG